MRDRKEIIKDLDDYSDSAIRQTTALNLKILEVLLDIRDLLKETKD